MKIATWNVNSLNVRKQHVLDWLASSQTDVLCLQELKLPDEKFPKADLEAAGYRSWFTGQKTYNGVAILVRDTLGVDETDVVKNIPGFEDAQQRVIAATVNGVRIVSAYFPNGQAPGTDKFAYKMQWLDALQPPPPPPPPRNGSPRSASRCPPRCVRLVRAWRAGDRPARCRSVARLDRQRRLVCLERGCGLGHLPRCTRPILAAGAGAPLTAHPQVASGARPDKMAR